MATTSNFFLSSGNICVVFSFFRHNILSECATCFLKAEHVFSKLEIFPSLLVFFSFLFVFQSSCSTLSSQGHHTFDCVRIERKIAVLLNQKLKICSGRFYLELTLRGMKQNKDECLLGISVQWSLELIWYNVFLWFVLGSELWFSG